MRTETLKMVEIAGTPATFLGYTRADWLFIGLAALTLVPFVLLRFGRVGAHIPLTVAAVTALAIVVVAAAFFLS